jgi:hypothetical protein
VQYDGAGEADGAAATIEGRPLKIGVRRVAR